MKQLFKMLMLAGIVFFASCGNSEKEQLKKRIAELEAQVQTLEAQTKKPNLMDLEPIDNAKLAEFLGAFNASDAASVIVPISWQMEKTALQAILSKTDEAGHETIGVMIYPMKEKEHMKLAVIPYFQEGDQLKHFGLAELGAYNYSNMCPPGQNCATSDGDFGAATVESIWSRQSK
ncbi:MAG: hypothetical protein V4651_12140 [Bacteroidota bacterium]